LHWVSDVVDILDHLNIAKAHFVGLSMGGYTALMMGVHQPGRLLSLTAAGAGSGSDKAGGEDFRKTFMATADEFEKHGSAYVVERYGMGTARIPYLVKDPRGFAEFNEMFASHDPHGAARTLRGFQVGRPSLYDVEAEMRTIKVPTLLVVGDEDDPCLEPNVHLKQWIATSGLVVLPKTGHVVNQEEPALFNEAVADFIARVEAGRWPARDPRSIRK
jgi:proline iminopeptidase